MTEELLLQLGCPLGIRIGDAVVIRKAAVGRAAVGENTVVGGYSTWTVVKDAGAAFTASAPATDLDDWTNDYSISNAGVC